MSQGIPAEKAHAGPPEHDLVTTLFDLGRQVTAVLDLEDLLQQIPRLIRRLISFEAFAVYLLDDRRGELRAAYSIGYPDSDTPLRLRHGEGLVGAAVASEQPLLVNDLRADPRYLEFVPGMNSEIVVPLMHKSRPIGALNITVAALAAVTVALSMRVVGILLVAALMVLPVSAAGRVAWSMRSTLLLSMVIGLASALVGLTVSYYADLPPGGTIVLVAASAFAACAIVGSLRGR